MSATSEKINHERWVRAKSNKQRIQDLLLEARYEWYGYPTFKRIENNGFTYTIMNYKFQTI